MRLWLGSQDTKWLSRRLLAQGRGLRSASCRSLSVCRPALPRPLLLSPLAFTKEGMAGSYGNSVLSFRDYRSVSP